MASIIDMVIIAIVAFVVWRSAAHGFVRTVIEMVGYILAALLSITLSGIAADALIPKNRLMLFGKSYRLL